MYNCSFDVHPSIESQSKYLLTLIAFGFTKRLKNHSLFEIRNFINGISFTQELFKCYKLRRKFLLLFFTALYLYVIENSMSLFMLKYFFFFLYSFFCTFCWFLCRILWSKWNFILLALIDDVRVTSNKQPLPKTHI